VESTNPPVDNGPEIQTADGESERTVFKATRGYSKLFVLRIWTATVNDTYKLSDHLVVRRLFRIAHSVSRKDEREIPIGKGKEP
jgi:hypothetical protein